MVLGAVAPGWLSSIARCSAPLTSTCPGQYTRHTIGPNTMGKLLDLVTGSCDRRYFASPQNDEDTTMDLSSLEEEATDGGGHEGEDMRADT